MTGIYKIVITKDKVIFHVTLDKHRVVASTFSKMPLHVKEFIEEKRLLELIGEIQKTLSS